VISGFRGEVDENCVLLGHYAAKSLTDVSGQLIRPIHKVQEFNYDAAGIGNFLQTFGEKHIGPTDGLCRKVCKDLQLLAA